MDVFKGDTRVKHDIKTSAKLISLYRRHFNVSDEFLFQYFGKTSLCLLPILVINLYSTGTMAALSRHSRGTLVALSWHSRGTLAALSRHCEV